MNQIEENFGGPVYAMVIGISKYHDEEFRELKYAHKDAEDFKQYLIDKGVFETCIFYKANEDANLKKIKMAFGDLIQCRNKSKSANPLVIIFFSGYSEVDELDHYLIPYDSDKKYLNATAFTNKDFNDYLERLNTNKIVMFLDACYSGVTSSEKGSLNKFDPVVLGTGTGTGRHLITSCSKGELSYDGDNGNGIFTQHLLELLKCEGDDIIDDEEITTNNLFTKLLEKVMATSMLLRGKRQTPTMMIVGGQLPIKLGVNLKKKRERIAKEKLEQEKQTE